LTILSVRLFVLGSRFIYVGHDQTEYTGPAKGPANDSASLAGMPSSQDQDEGNAPAAAAAAAIEENKYANYSAFIFPYNPAKLDANSNPSTSTSASASASEPEPEPEPHWPDSDPKPRRPTEECLAAFAAAGVIPFVTKPIPVGSATGWFDWGDYDFMKSNRISITVSLQVYLLQSRSRPTSTRIFLSIYIPLTYLSDPFIHSID
jgi:hypothetical protein